MNFDGKDQGARGNEEHVAKCANFGVDGYSFTLMPAPCFTPDIECVRSHWYWEVGNHALKIFAPETTR